MTNSISIQVWISRTLVAGLAVSLSACATGVKRVEYPVDTDPQEKVTELRKRMTTDRTHHYDLMSPDHFKSAWQSTQDAQKKIEQNKPAREVLESAGDAEAHLQIAEQNAAKHAETLASVTRARDAAIEAGAHRVMPEQFGEIDRDFREMGQDIEAGRFYANARTLSKIEEGYAETELKAAQRGSLGEARALIENAEKNDAQDRAPHTLAVAKVKYDSAMRAIEASRRNPEGYERATQEALHHARKLDFVVKNIGESKGTESAAVQIFEQREELASTQSSLDRARKRETDDRADLAGLRAENKDYASKADLDRKIEAVRGEFKPEEAEVLRDGNKIVLRLKKMQFSTASSELAQPSIGTLEKVKEMIDAVPVTKVVVEGHTDSTGGKDVNMKLSQKRAEIVKDYLVADNTVTAQQVEVRGFGYERPLTSNKTKEGRATNRRVDVVIETEGRTEKL